MNHSLFEIEAWVEATKKEWLSKQIKLEPGAQPGTIDDTEAVADFKFPIEMRALYLVVNGFKDCDMTEGMISLWPMERVQEEYHLCGDKNFVGFCDYLINSHAVGFYKGRPGIFKSYDEFNPIADSFFQAMELMNKDAEDLI
jgi:hypothetical protein